jgi:acetyl-CoA/propionyl-CoA carboxylase, biotin carboxylase, biotin carboxyl carrier protein
MREVTDLGQLPAAIAAARREADAGFGDDRLMLERLLTQPRHIEVQVLADQHGNVLHLLERECSIQRRHQKIVEECPSPAVDPALRARLGEAAVTAARSVDYEGAGTVEFLLDASTLGEDEPSFAFLEMNTRLQVEHPVTELVTGLDLVEQQLRVAYGEPLAFGQDDVEAAGHAIEVRLYAEDPVSHLPQTGPVTEVVWPTAPWVRIDTGIEAGSEVTPYYDPMLAKLCVHADDRASACDRLRDALAETCVLGVITNLELLRAIVSQDAFEAGELTTGFIGDHLADWHPSAVDDEVAVAAAVALSLTWEATARDAFAQLGAFRLGGVGGTPVTLADGDREHLLRIRTRADGEVTVEQGGTVHQVTPDTDLGILAVVDGQRRAVWVHRRGTTRRLAVVPTTRHGDLAAAGGAAAFSAPMPGSVLEVAVTAGDEVAAGSTLVVVEAMKMEHPITAPTAGSVTEVHVRAGDRVDAGAPLVSFTAAPTAAP